jgi:hypothetical protein
MFCNCLFLGFADFFGSAATSRKPAHAASRAASPGCRLVARVIREKSRSSLENRKNAGDKSPGHAFQ